MMRTARTVPYSASLVWPMNTSPDAPTKDGEELVEIFSVVVYVQVLVRLYFPDSTSGRVNL